MTSSSFCRVQPGCCQVSLSKVESAAVLPISSSDVRRDSISAPTQRIAQAPLSSRAWMFRTVHQLLHARPRPALMQCPCIWETQRIPRTIRPHARPSSRSFAPCAPRIVGIQALPMRCWCPSLQAGALLQHSMSARRALLHAPIGSTRRAHRHPNQLGIASLGELARLVRESPRRHDEPTTRGAARCDLRPGHYLSRDSNSPCMRKEVAHRCQRNA